MNLLITGIHGFVGSNLVEALKNDHSIYGLDIVFPKKAGIVKTFSWNDVKTLRATFSPCIDAVVHLAGKAHDTRRPARGDTSLLRQEYFDINLGLTQKIFDYFLHTSATKFIFFSTVKAAAETVIGNFLTEDVISQPVGPYGESKIAAENYIHSQFSILHSQLKTIYILRPAMIHGPGNKGNLNLLYNFVKRGIPYPLGAFENRRSFTSIDNIAFVVKNLLEKDIQPGIYNVSDDETLSTNELIELIVSILGKKSRIWKLSPKLMNFAAKLGTVLHLPLNSERLRKLTENYVVCNEKIKKALQIEKMPIPAKSSFEKTIKSFKNQ
ncbi:MAG: NAD-dependent epimerase/dehydratase family protein [Candidatus Symbiothrix sp.]|jgi:nucleoside-diphosphate-sugar epimerase|nr:NAD-dependent epimerase/dehydratase family protein [Candidatus Symbiothrix sp.]